MNNVIVTLQGVIILRISDFRSFFDWDEFWSKKIDFIELFKNEIHRHIVTQEKLQEAYYFVSNDKEFYLMKKFYEWLINPTVALQRIELGQTELKIATDEGLPIVYKLGRLEEKISTVRKQNRLNGKSILGYTLLYMLLGANENDLDIPIEYGYEEFDNIGGFVEVKGYNRCSNNVSLEQTKELAYPIRRCVFVNVNQTNQVVIVSSGKQSVKLQSGECVIGVFSDNKCYKLLPSTIEQSNVTLKLKANLGDNRVHLEIHSNCKNEVITISDVYSIGVDSNSQPVYLSSDGEIYYDTRNFDLLQQYNGFKQLKESIVAMEVLDNSMVIYTESAVYR
jgi:hypothetical protein